MCKGGGSSHPFKWALRNSTIDYRYIDCSCITSLAPLVYPRAHLWPYDFCPRVKTASKPHEKASCPCITTQVLKLLQKFEPPTVKQLRIYLIQVHPVHSSFSFLHPEAASFPGGVWWSLSSKFKYWHKFPGQTWTRSGLFEAFLEPLTWLIMWCLKFKVEHKQKPSSQGNGQSHKLWFTTRACWATELKYSSDSNVNLSPISGWIMWKFKLPNEPLQENHIYMISPTWIFEYCSVAILSTFRCEVILLH